MTNQINAARLQADFHNVLAVIDKYPKIDKTKRVETAEFLARAEQVLGALREAGVDVGFVFSDEHYNGDVPYLGGNTNISIEQVAGIIGRTGFHLLAGLEGGYVAEQLAPRSGCTVHKVEMLQLADEEYPIAAETLEAVLAEANGGTMPKRIGLLTPREIIPVAIVDYLRGLVGAQYVVDAQAGFQKIKYEKSDREMELLRDATLLGDAVMEAMLVTLKPGMLETQVAAWGYFVAFELGAEELGFDIIVGAGEANRTLIGKALNREIAFGDYVHLGVSVKRDGLTACTRRSVIAVPTPAEVSEEQRFWFDLVEGAYAVGLEKYIEVAEKGLPAKLQEQALVDYYAAHAEEVSQRIGKPIALEQYKPYTGTHNGGYTECQEFYGAITLHSEEPLGRQIVTMLDVALRGIGNYWHDVVIPGFDYLVLENTLGKFGSRVKVFNTLPNNVQHLVHF